VNYDIPIPKIILDTYQGTYKAVDHLISVGCKNIGLLLGHESDSFYTEMVSGYKSALSASNIKEKNNLIVHNELTIQDIENSLEDLYNSENKPDGIIACNNFVALQIMVHLRKMEMKVPEDVSIVSIGNEPFNEFISPSITTIRYSGYDLGTTAFKELCKTIKNKQEGVEIKDNTIIKSIKLVIRGSSMRN